jgi:hypothetical protein
MNMKIGSMTTQPPKIESIVALDSQRPKSLTPPDPRAPAGVLSAGRPSGVQTRSFGGRSALTGSSAMSASPMPGGAEVSKNWGPHCMSNVLPYIIEPALPTPAGR